MVALSNTVAVRSYMFSSLRYVEDVLEAFNIIPSCHEGIVQDSLRDSAVENLQKLPSRSFFKSTDDRV